MRFPPRLPIPEEVLGIARKLEEAGFETWCVGGAVRDNLLGHENKDFDLATAARPEEVQRLFRRTIPLGVEHGTVAVLDKRRRAHEVTTFRRDIATDGRHAVVAFGVSIDDDLARRDFTINAIAYHPLRHEWRDPHGGARDLDAGIIRAVGDPTQRFREDYLRILRALRFAARFGFRIDPPTWEAARATVEGLRQLSAERVREEWFRGLVGARRAGELVELWCDVGAVAIWMPEVSCEQSARVSSKQSAKVSGELSAKVSSEQSAGADDVTTVSEASAGTSGPDGTPSGPAHRAPLTQSTHRAPRTQSAHRSQLTFLDWFEPRDPVLMTACLSSDPKATLTRLKCSNADVERGWRIGEHRDVWPDPEADVGVRRWMAAAGPAVDDLVAIARAEGRGDALPAAVDRVRESGAPLTVADLAIDGTDLMKAGIPEGPAVGVVLRALLAAVLEDPTMNVKGRLLQKAKDLQSTAPAHSAQRTARRRGLGK